MTHCHRWILATLTLVLTAQPANAQTFADHSPATLPGFGGAIAVAGHDVLVGEPANIITPGVVYVYRKTAGAWAESARLRASDAAPEDGFGSALAADGETFLVSGNQRVYVFERDGETWRETARLEAADARDSDAFGLSLAISGDVALVGAPRQNAARGVVYVFRRAEGAWVMDAKLTPTGGEPGDQFGIALAYRGSRLLVGVPGAVDRTGVVRAYELDQDGPATFLGTFAATGGQSDELFGAALDVSGGLAFVGAPGRFGTVGSVHVLRWSADAARWVQISQLLPFDGGIRFNFGATISAEPGGRAVWVGAPGGNAAYRFHMAEEGERFVQVNKVAPDRAAGTSFAANMAAGGSIAAFGMPRADYGAGQAAIFELGASGEWTQATRVLGELEGFERVAGEEIACSAEGDASAFSCEAVDLVSFVPVSDLGANRGVGTNDVWGWTDRGSGSEYALVGMQTQTSFVDLSDPLEPTLVGRLLLTPGARPSTWRDIKVYRDHAYIVSDGAGQHGMQVFDLTRLRDFDGEVTTFEPDAVYDRIASAHNIVITEDTGFAYAVGSGSGGETCGGGLHMIDIREPKSPKFAGCFADPQTGRASTGYSHDAQCVIYDGPDEAHRGHEICLGSNETALSIADVTDKQHPVAIARASYPNVGYSHQGWISEDHRYFYMDDELDEIQAQRERRDTRTRTLIWDISELDDPQLVAEHRGATEASDHNLYVVGKRMYQSNYQSGLRVLDISDPESPVEVGYFDTVPYGTNTPGFGGSWSNYPFFDSGLVIVTSEREGLFVLRPRDRAVF